MSDITASHEVFSRDTRVSIGFLNWAHAMDHYVLLIYPTVVIGLEAVYARTYGELIALSTAAFIAFGVFSLPAGWLADHWSRRNMMAVFWFGCGASLFAAGAAPNLVTLAIALGALGMFAAIYHPVGMAMLIEASKARGRTLAFNGVCGNLGVALAAGVTALIASMLGWRMAFFVPAVVCIVTGSVYLWAVQNDITGKSARKTNPDVRLGRTATVIVFGLFIVIALGAGLAFNVITVALPKVIDERAGEGISLLAVGSIATAVFVVGGIAQLAVGRLVERIAPHVLFVFVTLLLFTGAAWSVVATGPMVLVALALAMAGVYGQVTVNDIVLARYTADAWRGRVYAVRYFLVFITAGIAVASIAFLHQRGGFDLVLLFTAGVCLMFFLATLGLAYMVSGAESRKPVAMPAE
ncbi:MFS transporter [Pseudorhodoplanes sp.]|uniref:MFS transporter n=1 Tax=Pseudorhodoplanes sp. TaxID=1934341 RepID=UPI003918A017